MRRHGLGLREARAWGRPSLPWKKERGTRAPWRAGSGCPARRGNARARGVSGRPPTAPPAHPVRGNSIGWLRGCRESARGPHLYPDTSPGKEKEGRLEKARGCWLPFPPVPPGERRDPLVLGGVGSLGSGSRREIPGCLHHCGAPEMTRVVSSRSGWFRAGDPPPPRVYRAVPEA